MASSIIKAEKSLRDKIARFKKKDRKVPKVNVNPLGKVPGVKALKKKFRSNFKINEKK